jgi:hypothetical protein
MGQKPFASDSVSSMFAATSSFLSALSLSFKMSMLVVEDAGAWAGVCPKTGTAAWWVTAPA